MAPKDYYQILKIRWGATPEEIREAYRRLARQHHPDLNPGDDHAVERLKEINEAYEVLSDPQKQAHYEWLHNLEPRQTAYRSEPHQYYHSDTDFNLPAVSRPARISGWDLLERFFQIMDEVDEAMEVRWKRFRRSWEDY